MFVSARKRLVSAVSMTSAAGAAFGILAAPASAEEGPQPPKNIIVLISDGAGYNQFDIASLYESGQTYRQVRVDPAAGTVDHLPGTPTQVYENYPVQVGQSHYSASGRAAYTTEDAWGDFSWVASGATDSAAAGTALGTGIKTNNGMLGFDPNANRLVTVGEQAKAMDKKVGLVTSVPFNHATPAGFIAHNASRNDYHGLATEMIDSGVDVLMGGGHPYYTDDNTTRSAKFGPGSWISQADFDRVSGGQTPFTFIDAKSDFEALATSEDTPEKVFGLAQVSETLQYNRSGLAHNNVLPGTDRPNNVPSLATMTNGALNVLEEDPDGFFLMVEAGAVDWAGHANQTTRVIEEQMDFNDSVEAVNAWVEEKSNWDETLVIVTADHETGYLAGSGSNPGWEPMQGVAGQVPGVSWHSGGHTNALVPLYAKGAGADLLTARADQWDLVRGAYVDNIEIGQTIFDLLGAPAEVDPSSVAIEATIAPTSSTPGHLALSVPTGGSVSFVGDGSTQQATLPQIAVTDTRTEVQAMGRGWTLAGSAQPLTAGNQKIEADKLAWSPRIVSSDNGANAGGAATLQAPAALAAADRSSRVGTTIAEADLAFSVPTEAVAGRYSSAITLTLFPQD